MNMYTDSIHTYTYTDVCICLCIYIYIYIYIYLCIHIHIYTYIHISICIYIEIYVYESLPDWIVVCVHVCMCVWGCVGSLAPVTARAVCVCVQGPEIEGGHYHHCDHVFADTPSLCAWAFWCIPFVYTCGYVCVCAHACVYVKERAQCVKEIIWRTSGKHFFLTVTIPDSVQSL